MKQLWDFAVADLKAYTADILKEYVVMYSNSCNNNYSLKTCKMYQRSCSREQETVMIFLMKLRAENIYRTACYRLVQNE
jgi:hypothetical protein